MDLKITFLTSGTGTWSITSQFMVIMITERAINQISQTARDAPWSFLFIMSSLWKVLFCVYKGFLASGYVCQILKVKTRIIHVLPLLKGKGFKVN